MPSPFPGMDPYLEKLTRWVGGHNKLITYIEATLNTLLPPPYAADVEVRCYIERPNDMVADLAGTEQWLPVLPPSGSGNTAVLTVDPALKVQVFPEEETREAFVNILNMQDNQRVVTTIEMLSHTNKNTRNKGREIYLKKQKKILESRTHFLEIDLLRSGTHTLSAPQESIAPEYPYDYLVCLHRAGSGGEFEVWPNTLRQRLPRVAVPLNEGVPDIVLDLQAVFDEFYDAGIYARKIDYIRMPEPPLNPEDAAWADALLREKGLRTE